MNKKIIIPIILVLIVVIALAFIIYKINNKEEYNSSQVNTNENNSIIDNKKIEKKESEEMKQDTDIKAIINNKEYKVDLENNDTVKSFLELLPQEFNMNELNGNEKYINLNTTLPTNSYSPKHIDAGDIMLFGNNCLVVFYKSFDTSYSYTKIGHIDNLPDLGNRNITIRFEKNNSIVSERNEFNMNSKKVKLNNGYEMPIFGLGTWQLTGETAENSVYWAIKDGYRLIDTAYWYGNEKNVGNAVRKAIDEGIVTREELFITTKLPPYGFNDYEKAIDDCNERLGLEYIDLMLIHQSGSDEKDLYRAIEKKVSEGVVKSLGISNYYTKDDFDDITENAKIMPTVIQNENHIFYNDKDFQDYVGKYGTIIESYYPLGGRGHTGESLNNEVISKIANNHNKTSAQIILRWHLQSGFIAIPGSSNESHILENCSIFDFELSDNEMQEINNLNTGERYENW